MQSSKQEKMKSGSVETNLKMFNLQKKLS